MAKLSAQRMIKDLIAQHNPMGEEHRKIDEILGRELNLMKLGMLSIM